MKLRDVSKVKFLNYLYLNLDYCRRIYGYKITFYPRKFNRMYKRPIFMPLGNDLQFYFAVVWASSMWRFNWERDNKYWAHTMDEWWNSPHCNGPHSNYWLQRRICDWSSCKNDSIGQIRIQYSRYLFYATFYRLLIPNIFDILLFKMIILCSLTICR